MWRHVRFMLVSMAADTIKLLIIYLRLRIYDEKLKKKSSGLLISTHESS